MRRPPATRQTLSLGPCSVEYLGNADTQVLGVVGHPVSRSLSPRMQQAALDVAGRDAVYLALEVGRGDLDAFVRAARRAPQLRGFNVTVPHKSAIVGALDDIDAVSTLAGAVNTVVIDASRRLQGFNTDIAGLREVWRQHHVVPGGRRLVIVGAGGLARAAVVAGLHEAAAEICVLNRHVPRARAMLDDIRQRWDGSPPALHCATLGDDIDAWLSDAVALVQATPAGMPDGAALPLSLANASEHMFVLEGLYGETTQMLREARARNLSCVDGRALLVAQGAASWRLWMQADADVAAMRHAVDL